MVAGLHTLAPPLSCCVLLLLFSSAPAQHASAQTAVRVMTWNIRFHNPQDGPDAWPHRRDAVADWIGGQQVDIIGFQEALKSQIDDLAERLPAYAWFGVGRDDGVLSGEFVPIFYRRDRFQPVDRGAFWLSEQPDQPGRLDWGAACARVTTWLKLRDVQNNRHLVVYNTHFDHVSGAARQKGAELIRQRIAAHTDLPRVLMGDFNCLATSQPLQTLVAAPRPEQLPVLQPAIDIAARRAGPDSTWTGFREIVAGRRIDHVFVGGPVTVARHEIPSPKQGDRFLSDHLPVLVEIEFQQ